MFREGPSKKMTFEQRSEEGEGREPHGYLDSRMFQAERAERWVHAWGF